MKYLPIENITYKTRLTEEEVKRRLADFVETDRLYRFRIFGKRTTKAYVGKIKGQTFVINRNISYRNSFLPRIYGIIERDFDGLSIKVKMRLHSVVIVFLGILFGLVGLGCIAVLEKAFSESEFKLGSFMLFVMFLFGYLLTMGGFKFESKKSKKDLQTIFEAEIIES